MPKRDDFKQATKTLLAKRVGYRCSKPSCRLQTVGPSTNEQESINLGVAAHITAASEGGPRYDFSLTQEQRSSAVNGIWLCQTCSKLIDSDVAKFTVAVLNEWKATAEHFAESENQGYLKNSKDVTSIFVAAGEWETWVETGNQSTPGIIVVRYFGAGDVVYSCNLRFQNRSTASHLLINPRVELVLGDTVLESVDANVIEIRDIELPVDKWVRIGIHNGFDGSKNFSLADSVWFRCEVVGQESDLRLKLATL